MAAVSFILGVLNLIQFLISLFTGSSQRTRMQHSFNDWYRVAEIGDQIASDPSKAPVLIRAINGIADSARNEIKAYSKEHLKFEPYFDPAHASGPNPPPKIGFWRTIFMAFTPK
jgi:hypothetical protein